MHVSLEHIPMCTHAVELVLDASTHSSVRLLRLRMWFACLRGIGPRFGVIAGCSAYFGSNTGPSECAPSRRNQASSAAPAPSSSFPARTSFLLKSGNPAQRVEDRLELPQDSPLVTALPFMEWELHAGPPPIASAPRSRVVSTLIVRCRLAPQKRVLF